MSLTKAIEHGKERRRPRKYPARSCWNHGDCPRCQGNRLFGNKKRRMKGVETDEISRD